MTNLPHFKSCQRKPDHLGPCGPKTYDLDDSIPTAAKRPRAPSFLHDHYFRWRQSPEGRGMNSTHQSYVLYNDISPDLGSTLKAWYEEELKRLKKEEPFKGPPSGIHYD